MMARKYQSAARLSELLNGIAAFDQAFDCEITGLSLDSRQVKPGGLFLACGGYRTQGHDYVEDAIRAGAAAVLWETEANISHSEKLLKFPPAVKTGVPVISVDCLREKVGEIAARFFGHPSRDMLVIGVTGTNGKTSCSQFIAQVLNKNVPCGVIGTVGYGLYGRLRFASHTTPDAVTLQALLAEMRDSGARSVVMEVSSHGLDQGRINGTAIDIAVFTNLSRDHLDYHNDMKSYGQAKQRLFAMPGLKHAVINTDDAYGREVMQSLSPSIYGIAYGLAPYESVPQVLGHDLLLDEQGIQLSLTTPWGNGRLQSGLLGRFNASNLLAVIGTLLATGRPLEQVLTNVRGLTTVAGRMERFGGEGAQPLVVVDYAHTPDALEHALRALRDHHPRTLTCVFGCGGDRDRGKRPLMGKVAEQLADKVIVTDDNPRSESPADIVADILTGLEHPDSVMVIHDRATAIAHAIDSSGEGDIILVAGKGHEDYQLVGDRKLIFSDREQVAKLLQRRVGC